MEQPSASASQLTSFPLRLLLQNFEESVLFIVSEPRIPISVSAMDGQEEETEKVDKRTSEGKSSFPLIG